MRKLVLGFTLMSALAMTGMAAEWSGYISDAGCAKKQTAKAGTADHEDCAKSCLKKGDKAVLVTPDGKVFQIANQDKVLDHGGQKVTLVGEIDADNITVSEVK